MSVKQTEDLQIELAESKKLVEELQTFSLEKVDEIGRQGKLIEGLIKELDASHVRLTTVVDVIVKYGLGRITN